jgi:transcription-repair coupling factor (superfamily II helicase)
MRPVLDALLGRADVAAMRDEAARGRDGTVVAPAALEPLVAAAIATVRPVLAVTASGREAEDLAAVLREFTEAVEFPAWETLPHERLSPSADTVGRRLDVLHRLRHPGPGESPRVVVAPVRALLQPIVRGLGDIDWIAIAPGDEVPVEELPARLVEFGYQRTDLVDRRGQFAVRGGIIDVFPPTLPHPVRLEFWGDTVEDVRSFAVVDQRSLDMLDGVRIGPVREVLLTPQVRERARAEALRSPAAAELLDKIAEGLTPDGMEALAPLLVDGMETLLDVIAPDCAVILCEPERIRARAADLVATSQEFLEASWHNAAAGNSLPLDVAGAAYYSLDDVRERGPRRPWWSVTPFESGAGDEIVLAARATEDLRGDPSAAIAAVAAAVRSASRVIWVCSAAGTADRIAEQLAEVQIAVTREATDQPGVVRVLTGALEAGFRTDDLLVVSEAEVVGQRSSTRDMRRLPSRRRATLDPLQLREGDFVVHEQHGVGRYVEMAQRAVGGATREYLVLEYAASKRGQPADRLYVPMDQLDQVTRYVGGEAPTVHRLGGADWQKAKGRARKAVRQIAGDLIKLYAARMSAKGHSFGPDTEWQRELEDAFGYVETPDQLSCIDEVKRDMERATPMDRLICGDVGYGKTEIAVRAAFKAVQDGKQVAVLVPTTLLVQQHLSTFRERFAAFPVTVEALSRFQTDREAAAVVEQVAKGTVDVVIGTHRLLTSGIRFKDLGLIIVDEEQRFGVEHKEHLKALRTNVDVLTMSATPIPRSLEMSITGIRDMSTIQTPPEERLPVLTYVGPYDQRHVVAAIHRELMRDGQVFFVHNRVESIDRVAALVRELVPDARVAVAHGQLPEHVLEQVIVDFWEKRTDVLVCTTIVESGLDISNANTLIVDRADLLGLSQLHQLRGRVGRGRERAYAYFLYPPERPLSEAAHDRLATIAAHTDLGSGIQIAMKDLEIRGAGNLLGGEQSGHIADVGFDLYVRLVGEALAEVRGESDVAPAEMRIELPVDARIPEEFVPQERLRLDLYRRLAGAVSAADVEAVRAEILDRFGTPPSSIDRLLALALLRVEAREAGLTEIVLAGTAVRFHPVELLESATMRLTRLYPRTVVKPPVRTILVPRPAGEVDLIEWAATLIRECLTPTRSAK